MAAIVMTNWIVDDGLQTLSPTAYPSGRLILAKSAAFGVVHLGVAFGVSYALTGSVAIAGAITLIEPLVNTVAHYFFDRWWGHPKAGAALQGARLKLQQSVA